MYYVVDESSYSLLLSVLVLHYQQPCHKCCHFVAAQTLLPTTIARRQIHLTSQNGCRFISQETTRHVNRSSDRPWPTRTTKWSVLRSCGLWIPQSRTNAATITHHTSKGLIISTLLVYPEATCESQQHEELFQRLTSTRCPTIPIDVRRDT
jgi:hypothetical protein